QRPAECGVVHLTDPEADELPANRGFTIHPGLYVCIRKRPRVLWLHRLTCKNTVTRRQCIAVSARQRPHELRRRAGLRVLHLVRLNGEEVALIQGNCASVALLALDDPRGALLREDIAALPNCSYDEHAGYGDNIYILRRERCIARAGLATELE